MQELQTLAEKRRRTSHTAEAKTLIVRYTGTPIKFTVTREQFERLTTDLLDETIRITARTLAEAEKKYPGIKDQISEVLLVGGSTKMPAVSEALKREFGWTPKLADPDLAVAKGAALYAAGQTVRFVEHAASDSARAAGTEADQGSGGGSVTPDAVRAVAARTGISEEQVAGLARRTVVNVLPKAIGIKLIDTEKPGWEDNPESASYIEHLVDAQTPLPFPGRTFVAQTASEHQPEIEIEIWEQAGASPGPELSENQRVEEGGRIRGLAPFALPAGSPVNIEIKVDAEGTVHLVAIEPASGHELKMSVRISILSEEQVAEAKVAHAGLTVST